MTMHYPKTEAEWLKLRHGFVSSTESSALFGMSSYVTPFELATMKKAPEPVQTMEQTERMKWGLRLQEAIAKGISDDYGVKVRRVRGYSVLPDVRMGASFDYEIVGTFEGGEPESLALREMYRDFGAGVLEIKNVDSLIFRNQWRSVDEEDKPVIEAPDHIEIQLQHQLECIDRKWGVLGVFIGGNRTEVILRDRDEEVGEAIVGKVSGFWADLAKGIMPPVKLPEDIGIIRLLYQKATPDKIFDARGNNEVQALCIEYLDGKEQRDAGEARRKVAGAKLLPMIGDASKVLADGYSIQANEVGECPIPATVRSGYRNLVVRAKKP